MYLFKRRIKIHIKLKMIKITRLFCLSLTIFLSNHITTYLYATNINGFYETEFVVREGSDFKWNLTTPRHYFQMKFWSNPLYGLDLYAQTVAMTHEPWKKKEYFDFERSWIKYWFKKGEIILLLKEERHWIDSPLLKNVDQGKASFFNNGYGVRLNIFKVGPLDAGIAYTKIFPLKHQEWYGNYFDEEAENFISKTNFTVLDKGDFIERITIGGSYLLRKSQQKKFTDKGVLLFSPNITNEVVSSDLKLNIFGATLVGEYATSKKDGSANSPLSSEDRSASAFELRDLYIRPFRFQTRFYNYGDGYRNELSRGFGRLTRDGNDSDKEFGRKGYYFESSYLWPGKMVTFTYRRNNYTTNFDYLTNNQNIREDYIIYKTDRHYDVIHEALESQVEFINGIRNKVVFERTQNRSGRWPGILFELSGDTRDVYSRVQFRLKDIGSNSGLGERRILSGEIRYNLTDNLQFYTRAVSVESLYRHKNWASAFYQLRYFIGWDIECYLEYGDGWHTDNLVYDGDIVDYERNLTNMVKLLFKVNF